MNYKKLEPLILQWAKDKRYMKTFITSFFQIMLVAINTIFLMQKDFIMVFIVSCLISLLWALNVAKVSVSTTKLKLIYSLGAGCGAITGLYLTTILK